MQVLIDGEWVDAADVTRAIDTAQRGPFRGDAVRAVLRSRVFPA